MHFNKTPADSWAKTIVAMPLGARPLKSLSLDRLDPLGTNNLALEPDNFKIRLANSEGRRESADLLIREMYSWRGYDTAGVLNDEPNRITLMADLRGNAIGTLTIGIDSTAGLLVDQLYKDEIDRLRLAKALVCEFTKLAVDQGSNSRRVLAALFHLAFIYAHKIHGATDLVIEVNPRHVVFYKRMLGFAQLGEERMCPRVKAPAVLLRLACAEVARNIAKYGGTMQEVPGVRSLYPFAFSPADEAGITQRLLRGN
jgi:hypothetical protein